MPYSPKTWVDDDPITPTDLNRIETGLDEVTALAEDDSGWLTSGITAASGWSITAQNYRRIGSILRVDVQLQRTGGNLTVGASGDLGNTAICTLPVGYRPAVAQGLHCGQFGRLFSYFCDTTGIVYYAATVPSDTIVNSDMATISGVLFLG